MKKLILFNQIKEIENHDLHYFRMNYYKGIKK
jgi:hypothetical protein